MNNVDDSKAAIGAGTGVGIILAAIANNLPHDSFFKPLLVLITPPISVCISSWGNRLYSRADYLLDIIEFGFIRMILMILVKNAQNAKHRESLLRILEDIETKLALRLTEKRK